MNGMILHVMFVAFMTAGKADFELGKIYYSCQKHTMDCTLDSDCCSPGICIRLHSSRWVCMVIKRKEKCAGVTEACWKREDCCNIYHCLSTESGPSVCGLETRQTDTCAPEYGWCGEDKSCCEGYNCTSSICTGAKPPEKTTTTSDMPELFASSMTIIWSFLATRVFA